MPGADHAFVGVEQIVAQGPQDSPLLSRREIMRR